MNRALAFPEAEEMVLGAILVEPALLAEVRPVLPGPEPFSDTRYGQVYRAMLTLSDRHAPIDHLTLVAELGGSDDQPWMILLGELIDAGVAGRAVAYHARIVRETWQRRQLQAEAQRLTQLAADAGTAVGDVVSNATGRLVAIAAGDTPATPPLRAMFVEALEELERQATQQVLVRGLPSGFASLDRMTDGFLPSQLVILAARPGEGKSSLAGTIGTQAAEHGPVYWVSLEMSQPELVERILQEAVGCDMRRLRREAAMLDRYVAELMWASGRLSELPLAIDCETRTPGRLRLRLQAEIAQGRKPALVILDYLQLMDADTPQQNRDREIGVITKALKRLAMELDLPILLLSQLTRLSAKESRPPELYDLRDSGNIEQDANGVLMLHWPNGDAPGAVQVDLYVRKWRNGPKGKISLKFEPWTQRWREMYGAAEPDLQTALEGVA